MSPHSRLRINVGVPDEEPIQADVTLNSISIERAGDAVVVRFSSLLQCEVELCLSETDARDLIQQLSCFTQTP
ncbi:MAG: hypothetical protein NZ777_08890 [Pseudomonadales bacterium]|nr:hypothetical protein [Pseudomonadales bacterium]